MLCRTLILILLIIGTSAYAEMIFKYEKEGFVDKSWYENGNQIIERIFPVETSDGKVYQLRQKFRVIDSNTLEYIPHSSSTETVEYIQEICEKRGMSASIEPRPGIGFRRISMKAPFGMSCVSKN